MFQQRCQVLDRFVRKGSRVLDIGCAYGYFLEIAQQAGYAVSGVEINKEMARRVQERLGISCSSGADLDDLPSSQTFDCITMFDTIEHLEDPCRTLVACHRRLAPQGHLALTTPNIGSWVARLMGSHWPHVTPEEHLYYFDADTLRKMLRDQGFRPIWLGSARYRFRLREFVPKLRDLSGGLYRLAAAVEAKWPHLFEPSITLGLGDMFVIARKESGPV
jgi:SAM-dependent methyltransferase